VSDSRSKLPGLEERELKLRQRFLGRKRRKVFGLLLLAFIVLAIAFLRFGKSIPWGAR
jgi:hypothetical protein